MDAVTRKSLNNVGRSTPIVFVRDANNKIYCVGQEEGATVTVEGVTGQARGDQNGYNLNIVAEEKDMARLLQAYDPNTQTPFENFAGIIIDPPYSSGGGNS
jgi:hypothetical protein